MSKWPMETREKEIVARALEEVLSAWFDFTRSDRTFGQELEARISALRRTPPSPQSGGAVELYRCVKVPVGPLYAFGEKYERATKAEAVIEAAIEWRKHQEAFSDFDGDRRGIAEHLYEAKCRLLKALSALDKE
jgi:hypothetical protein